MDEAQVKNTSEQKSNLNPFLVIVIVIIMIAAGTLLWFGNSKNEKADVMTQSPTVQKQEATSPTQKVTESVAKTISVEGGNFYFKPDQITVKKGEKVTITLTSVGGMHDFVIDELNVKSEIINGGVTTVTFTPETTGTFEFYCSVGQHRQMGMKGELIVE